MVSIPASSIRFAQLSRLVFGCALAAARAVAVDGDYDNSFGEDGIADWTNGGSVEIATLAVKEATGAAYAVGTIELEGEEPALHFKGFNHGGGALDHECAQASDTLFTAASGGSGGFAGLVDSSGGLVVGGWAAFLGTEDTRRALVARFDLEGPGCDLDESFSSNGWAIFDDPSWCDAESCDIVDLVEIRPVTGAVPAPRIVALVRSQVNFLVSRFFLLGLTGSGGIDTDFGSSGWREVTATGLGPLYPEGHLEVDGRGGLVVLVTRYDPDGTVDLDVFALEYTAGGNLSNPGDPLFLVEGSSVSDADDPIGEDLAIAADGTWLFSYEAQDGLSEVRAVNLEAGESGSYDETTLPHQLAAQGDGKLISACDFITSDGFRSQRHFLDLPNDLPEDAAYGSNGVRPYGVNLGGFNPESIADMALWGGRPLFAGTAVNESGTSGFLLRAENAYAFADGFEQGTAALWSDVSGFDFPE